MLQKSLSEIGIEDLHDLIASRTEEGEMIEFKRELSTTKGRRDGWVEGRQEVGDEA